MSQFRDPPARGGTGSYGLSVVDMGSYAPSSRAADRGGKPVIGINLKIQGRLELAGEAIAQDDAGFRC